MGIYLETALRVSTPIALLSFVAAIVYLAYTRRLKYEEKKLEALPPEERATRTDEYLTRYGIDGKGLRVADKLLLIKDEMEKRHRRSFLYVIVAGLVFVACFALAASTFAPKPSPPPEPQPKTTLRVIDAETTNPVYRDEDLVLTYSVVGTPGEHTLRATKGEFEVPTDVKDIETLDVVCPPYHTYSFNAGLSKPLSQPTIALRRKGSDEEIDFVAKITPQDDADYFSNEVPPKKYKQEVEGQVVGQPLTLYCRNQTPYHLDLLVYKWIPREEAYLLPDVSPPEFPPTWSVLAPTCKPEQRIPYLIHTFDQRGVYFFVAGSVCARQAMVVWHGSLHRANGQTLEVSIDHANSALGKPKLVGKMKD